MKYRPKSAESDADGEEKAWTTVNLAYDETGKVYKGEADGLPTDQTHEVQFNLVDKETGKEIDFTPTADAGN